MTPERYEQINALADAAMELPRERRQEFVRRVCAGDSELQSRVGALILSYESSGAFLQTSAFERVARDIAEAQDTNRLAGARIQRYEIIERLGAGGIGEVWRARDPQLSRELALKLLSPEFAGDAEHVRRFQQEARAASMLNHPNIITVYDIGEVDGREFIAEELVPGETVRARIAHGPIPAAEALALASQVAAALSAAHAAGIVHRDIKPENIMIRPDGLVKVLDFGLARFCERGEPDQGNMNTRAGVILGTVRYMSPEQARGLKLDARSDIFSFGTVLYEMLSGTAPFSGPTPTDTMAAILTREPDSLSRRLPDLPVELERVVHRCMEKDVAQRHLSAAGTRARPGGHSAAVQRSRRSAAANGSRRVSDCSGGRRRRARDWRGRLVRVPALPIADSAPPCSPDQFRT